MALRNPELHARNDDDWLFTLSLFLQHMSHTIEIGEHTSDVPRQAICSFGCSWCIVFSLCLSHYLSIACQHWLRMAIGQHTVRAGESISVLTWTKS